MSELVSLASFVWAVARARLLVPLVSASVGRIMEWIAGWTDWFLG